MSMVGMFMATAAAVPPITSTPDASLPVTAGLVLRLDATSIVGLNDGDTVNTWEDTSTVGNDATKEMGTPIYKTNVYNGKPCVRFSITNDDTLGFTSDISDLRTMFFVAMQNPGGLVYSFIMGSHNFYDFHRGNNDEIWNSNHGVMNPGVYNGVTKLNGDVVNGDITKFGYSELKVLSLVASQNCNAGTITNDRPALNIHRSWYGDICEVLIYNTALSSDDVILVEQYLATKWGITL